MLHYKLIQRGDPRDLTAPKKFYASPASQGRKTIADICDDISGASSLSRGDVMNVILSLVDQIPKYLLDGKTVNLGELGSMRISFSSEGVDTAEEFTTARIQGTKLVFTPGTRLKESLGRAHFEAD